MLFHDWLVSCFRPARRRPPQPQRRPCLELLEERSLLSVFTVIDMGDAGIGFADHGDLRYCITQANANDESSNVIKFHRGLTGTIVLTQGPLDISKDLTIRGPADGNITISGNHRSGVFDITADPRVQAVTLADLTIADGTGITVTGRRVGGGLFNDHATITLDHVVVTGNAVASGGYGGGIENVTGTVILNASTVSGNSVAGNGFGGGIDNRTGTLAVNASTVSGNSVGSGQFGGGGGISTGGGVFVLNSSLIADNHVQATTGGGSGDGGGLALAGTITITDSTISGNTAGRFGGGIDILEPFPSNYQVSVTRSVIRGNQADSAGGLYSSGGTVTIDHTIVSGNSAAIGRGSGVVNGLDERMTITDSLISDNTGGSGIENFSQLTLSGSTIAGNSTPSVGGGLLLEDGTAGVVNCTFSGNRAGQSGGGIWMFGDPPPVGGNGVLELTSVTITQNVAEGVSSSLIGGGGLAAPRTPRANTRVTVRNTLIAGNLTASVGPDVFGYVDSLGYNLVGEVEDSRGWASTDSLGHTYAPLDPMLGPLQDNGGPTPTHALLAGSPAIETGDYRLLETPDQRGTIRLHNGINPPVDIGAFDSGVRYGFQIVAPAEVVAGEPFTVTVFPVDPFGFKVTAYTATIHFSSTDDAAVLPADYTFAPADAGVASFRVTLQTEGGQQLVVNDLDNEFVRGTTTVTVHSPATLGRPLAGFADLAFAEADPVDGWLPGRKHTRTN